MTCIEAQSLITRFINDELDREQAENFLEHMKECKVCREELEVSFALLTAIQHLEQDTDFDGNYKLELNRRLEKFALKLRRRRRKRVKNWVCLIILFGAICFGMEQKIDDYLMEEERERKLNYLQMSPMPEVEQWQTLVNRMFRVDGKDLIAPEEEPELPDSLYRPGIYYPMTE